MIPFRAFVHEPNNIITISDGNVMVSMDLAQFLECEPGYVLPAGRASVNYEDRSQIKIAHYMDQGGDVQRFEFPNAVYEGYIDKVAVYQAAEWERLNNPLYGLSDLAVAQGKLKYSLGQKVKEFVSYKPAGQAAPGTAVTRYDDDLKLELLARGLDDAITQGFLAWKTAVQTAYFTWKQQIDAAADLAALEALLDAGMLDYDWWEQRYGVAGSVHADPDIYTSQLVGA